MLRLPRSKVLTKWAHLTLLPNLHKELTQHTTQSNIQHPAPLQHQPSTTHPSSVINHRMRQALGNHHRQMASVYANQIRTPWTTVPQPLCFSIFGNAPRGRHLKCQSSASASAAWGDPYSSYNGAQKQQLHTGNPSAGPHRLPTTIQMTNDEKDQMNRELHSLNVAIGANILICIAKVWVHLISGSSAMLAEALHSVADILNQALLRVGVVKAMRAPTPSHPYGYLRDRFVWSLISAVGIFFLGAGASVFHGLHTLTDTRVVEGAMWSYIVLGVSALLEGYSLSVAAKYVLSGAKQRNMGVLAYIRSGMDPTTVAVMLEDGGAVAGLAIAGVCTALTHMTGNAMFDAMGSILVGGLLGLIAVFLVQKNRDLLLGRSMSVRDTEEVLNHLRRDPVVLYVTETKTEEIGPRVFRFKAEVAWHGDRLVERYLERCGRDALEARLLSALEQERAARAAGQSSPGALLGVLKTYGRDIINAVGAEVDRIESEIHLLNPGIRYVDLETDRGRSHGSQGPPGSSGSSHGGGAGQPVSGSSGTSGQRSSGDSPAGASSLPSSSTATAGVVGVPVAGAAAASVGRLADYSCTVQLDAVPVPSLISSDEFPEDLLNPRPFMQQAGQDSSELLTDTQAGVQLHGDDAPGSWAAAQDAGLCDAHSTDHEGRFAGGGLEVREEVTGVGQGLAQQLMRDSVHMAAAAAGQGVPSTSHHA